jgi:hypothetical protein
MRQKALGDDAPRLERPGELAASLTAIAADSESDGAGGVQVGHEQTCDAEPPADADFWRLQDLAQLVLGITRLHRRPLLTNAPQGVREQTGAGEGIRTLDPDLGKVVLYP